MTPVLRNADARRLFLHRHALAEPAAGPAKSDDLLALIDRLGFVQVDSVNTVERAHHMILWSRRPAYRPENLRPLLERRRDLFEHWTHDAAVIPMAFLPHWRLRFLRDETRIRERYRSWQGPEFEARLADILAHIAANGPVASGEVSLGEERPQGEGPGWWNWHPSKTALEFLWRTGQLAVSRRENFAKVYDLAERVYPETTHLPEAETIDWACNAALDRLGFATSGEIAAFWAKVTPAEARAWSAAALARGQIEEIAVEGADGVLRRSFARPGVVAEAAGLPEAPARLRVLSPFDPALRDRARAERLFGFHYRIEIFVPEAQRRYGYYVFPLLEGDRLVGRIDARAKRAEGQLQVAALWPENAVKFGRQRLARLEAELGRLARFSGCETVTYAPGWLREG
ncbi:winged helix-turn-helix domain-containing protein [Frigidibacter sp.]|uniref:winged helix-turn-helix domain-containing protein n=1 Tax=Frigidibacter sp. TaxID=2586418 RepID=UPI00273367ED|nr:crosslink repair DNA glycosylase YcaQ family protein [Frigidibacter sp.]MDP3341380.1 crosslink repair DNA glycosylase YcaQ family protein [Frigidibacter sp.]